MCEMAPIAGDVARSWHAFTLYCLNPTLSAFRSGGPDVNVTTAAPQ